MFNNRNTYQFLINKCLEQKKSQNIQGDYSKLQLSEDIQTFIKLKFVRFFLKVEIVYCSLNNFTDFNFECFRKKTYPNKNVIPPEKIKQSVF